jgi:hypothetical protein
MAPRTPAPRVKRVATPVSSTDMSRALINAWIKLFGNTPTKEQIAVVMAQNDLETGHRKSMNNYNVGNLTTSGFGTMPYFDDLETSEQVSPGVWEKANLKYRAYPDLDSGVLDYLKLIGKRPAFKYALQGDPEAFSKSLKMSKYYTGDEEPYTKSLVQLHAKYLKSKDYEKALSGAKDTVSETIPKPEGKVMPPQSLNSILDSYLRMIAATDKPNKKIYKKYLPNNDIVIKIDSSDYTNAVEFARILCSALDEELLSKSYTHADDSNVEINCSIAGPECECFETVKQLAASVSEAFKSATIKIGKISINTQCVMNKKSSYKQINLDKAITQHRKFLLKFI